MARYMFRELVVDSRTGLNPRKNFTLGTGSNYYITIKDIHDGKIIITDKTDRVSDDAIAIIKRRSRIKNGDVLFTSIGRIGETAIVTNKDDTWDVNESVFVFTLNTSLITQDFFCILFQSKNVQEKLARDSSGSTFKSIKMNQLEKMSFDIPDIEEQKQTAGIMRKINKLIALRKEQLAALDQLVKSRFIELFGDCTNRRNTVLLEEISDFVTVGIANSATHAYADSGIVMLRNQNIKENYLDENDLIYITPDFAKKYESKQLAENDILVIRTGYPGVACLVPKKYEGCQTFTTLIVRLKDSTSAHANYVCHYINSSYGRDYVEQSKVGVAQQNFGAKALAKMPVAIPPMDLQEQMAAFVEQTDKSKLAIQRSLDELETLKKALMQKYFR